ncbi:Yip1 domain family protein [Rhodotorula diobovata]|uniref:Protein YIP n=1 Tax=Rhodotorula diobovata TaxID=5288 RepID=A0A5C5G3H1_9BASI|nr:Yip1 domain family protein [Rhodotorula diobovata]
MSYYSSGYGPPGTAASSDPNLAFYSTPAGQPSFYSSEPSSAHHEPLARTDLSGAIGGGAQGGRGAGAGAGAGGGAGTGAGAAFGGQITVQNWWNAFTPWTGMDGEPPLLEELGINFDHILQKSLTVLNPLRSVDPHIMDDADLAGPLVFCFVFASFLLLSGKPQFSYIYGVALIGSTAMYCLLNLMSESGIDAYRTASVLGYCILPLVLLSMFSVVLSLDGMLGYILSSLAVLWCSYSASSIFASVLHLSHQRFLVGYPVGLLYTAFSLFVFEVEKVKK